MKINNPNINPKRPILINNITDYNRVLKHLDGLGYTWHTGKNLTKTILHQPPNFPFYLYCHNTKKVYYSPEISITYEYNKEWYI